MARLGVVVGFALIVMSTGTLVSLPVPLYLTEGCAQNYCFSNVPRVPLIPLLAGVVVALALAPPAERARARTAGLGVVAGLAAALLLGLLEAASIPFQDPYFAAAYHLYALGYVMIASGAAAGVLVRLLRDARVPALVRWLAAALVVTLVFGSLAGILRGERFVGGAALAAAVAGAALSYFAGHMVRLRALYTERRMLFTIIFVAFAFRAIFGLQALARTGPGMAFAVASDDGDSYYTYATRVVTDPGAILDVIGGKAFPPGYTLFLAGVLALADGSLAAVIVLQALLAAVSGALLYALTRSFAGAATALTAAALFAANQNLIQNSSTLAAEALLVPLVLGFLWAIVLYRRTLQLRWVGAAALLLALSFLTRNVAVPPLLVASLVWLFLSHRSRPGDFVRVAAVLVGILALAALPTAIITASREGTPRLTSQLAALGWEWEGGPGMTIGNGFLLERGIHPFNDPIGSVQRVVRDPLPVLGFLAQAAPQRVSTLLFFASPGLSDPLKIVNPVIRPNSFGELIEIILVGALIVSTAIFFARRAYRERPETGLIAASVILYVAVFAFIFPPYHPFRYRIPAEVLLSIAQAAGLVIAARFLYVAWSSSPRLRTTVEAETYGRATQVVGSR